MNVVKLGGWNSCPCLATLRVLFTQKRSDASHSAERFPVEVYPLSDHWLFAFLVLVRQNRDELKTGPITAARFLLSPLCDGGTRGVLGPELLSKPFRPTLYPLSTGRYCARLEFPITRGSLLM